MRGSWLQFVIRLRRRENDQLSTVHVSTRTPPVSVSLRLTLRFVLAWRASVGVRLKYRFGLFVELSNEKATFFEAMTIAVVASSLLRG